MYQTILKQYAFSAELHCHTAPVSTCAKNTATEIVRAYLEAGCDSLTITNHLMSHTYDASRPAEEAARFLTDYEEALRAAEGTALTVILGAELRFPGSDNDYLLYGITPEDIEEIIPLLPLGLAEFSRRYRSPKRVLMQAHPFRRGLSRAPVEYLDGIELFNLHPSHNAAIGLAAKYVRDNRLLISGGSDFHSLDRGDLATCLTRTREKLRDSFDVVDVLRSGDFILDLSGNLILPFTP